MENRGLIFIPDISGFTRFVNDTEVEHSRHIIQELLETLINANQIGLEVSEVEGDAILFYKYGNAPDLSVIYHQVEKMFCEFHRHLLSYDLCRICQCTACKSAVRLSLKVITHYGEFTSYTVKNFSKLIGRDIIVAHQLLKNDIEKHEYWLVTDGLIKNQSREEFPEWLNWNNSTKQTEEGEIPFQYTHLAPLKENIPPVSRPQLEIEHKQKVLSVTHEFDAEINTLFFAVVNFDFRQRWQVGVKKADKVSHAIPRVGTSHCCVLEKGQQIMYTSGFSYSPEIIVYSETDEKKRNAVYFTFEKKTENKTKLTVDLYLKKNSLMLAMFKLLMQKKIEKEFRQSSENLAALVKEVKIAS